MNSDKLAAIRAAAVEIEKGMRSLPNYSRTEDPDEWDAYEKMTVAREKIFSLLDEAEKDGMTQRETFLAAGKSNGLWFECTKCSYQCAATSHARDKHCPGCGRRIERGNEG